MASTRLVDHHKYQAGYYDAVLEFEATLNEALNKYQKENKTSNKKLKKLRKRFQVADRVWQEFAANSLHRQVFQIAE